MNQTSNLASTFDPSKLVTVTPNQRRDEPYHMRYSQATKRFRFSLNVFTALDLNSNGVSIFQYPSGDMILSVQDEENSQVLKTRSNAKVKGKEFTSRTLANGLSVNKEGRTDLVLTPLPSPEGTDVQYFSVSELKEGDTLPSLGADPESDEDDDEDDGATVGRVASEDREDLTDESGKDLADEDQGDSEDVLGDDDGSDFDDDDDDEDDNEDDDLADFN